jgi:hypothetical protein
VGVDDMLKGPDFLSRLINSSGNPARSGSFFWRVVPSPPSNPAEDFGDNQTETERRR